MIENNPTSLVAAFEMLLEEIEAEIEFTSEIGARAFESRDYERAREALERAAQITAFRDKADSLRREWDALTGRQTEPDEGDDAQASARRDLSRLARGLRTREEAFRLPILQALVELGGAEPMADVLENVCRRMQTILKDVDYQPLASDPNLPRWRNTAEWAKAAMVKEGANGRARTGARTGTQHLGGILAHSIVAGAVAERFRHSKIGRAFGGVEPRLAGTDCRAVQSSNPGYSTTDIGKKPVSLQRAPLEWLYEPTSPDGNHQAHSAKPPPSSQSYPPEKNLCPRWPFPVGRFRWPFRWPFLPRARSRGPLDSAVVMRLPAITPAPRTVAPKETGTETEEATHRHSERTHRKEEEQREEATGT